MKNKLKIYLKGIKKPFTFNIDYKKFLQFLNILEESDINELINIENIYFFKKEFSYIIFE